MIENQVISVDDCWSAAGLLLTDSVEIVSVSVEE